jgi:hypothetical protein
MPTNDENPIARAFRQRRARIASAALLAGIVATCVMFAASARGGPPPGATARCRDGTYSFSAHRSGTCSHHGGVARWLSSTRPSRRRRAGTTVQVGTTVLLGRRTRTGSCRLGALPDRRCSPGAYYSGLTKAVLCSTGFRTSSIRHVPQAEKDAVERAYGLAPRRYGRTLEIDHIVSLELGGSNAIANLFPERAAAARGYGVKDRLENAAHRLVCAGRLALRDAQRAIARNWVALYKQVFGVPAG